MKSSLRAIACSSLCLLVGGFFAQANGADAGKKPEDLLKTSWALVSISTAAGEATLPNPNGITLTIDENGGISGRSGVNRYFGSVSIVDGKLAWSPMGTTQMAGPPENMAAESLFLKSLSRATTYEIDNGVVTFSDEASKTKVVMKAAKAADKDVRRQRP